MKESGAGWTLGRASCRKVRSGSFLPVFFKLSLIPGVPP